nr:MAG TPA: hypothetical protein [Caudoviricetes sp.]
MSYLLMAQLLLLVLPTLKQVIMRIWRETLCFIADYLTTLNCGVSG